MAQVQVLHAVLQSGIRWRVTHYCDSAAGALVRFEKTCKGGRLLHQQLARWSPLDGPTSRIGPGPLRGSLTPPRCWEGSCAAPSMAPTHSHLHTHRRLWLQGTSTWFLLSLSEACSVRSLARLGELVEDVLHQRWRDQPPVALDPEMLSLLPY